MSTYNLAIFTGTRLSTQEEEALDIHRSGTLTRLEKMESSLRQVALALRLRSSSIRWAFTARCFWALARLRATEKRVGC